MWAWWHKLCERYFANWKKVYKHQFAFFWKIQEEKRIKFASVKAGTTVAWWCRATAKTSPFQRLTSSTNLIIRLDFVSWTGYIFQHCGLRGEYTFFVFWLSSNQARRYRHNATKSSLVWCATDCPCYHCSRPPTWEASSLPLLYWGHLQVLFGGKLRAQGVELDPLQVSSTCT